MNPYMQKADFSKTAIVLKKKKQKNPIFLIVDQILAVGE